VRGRISRSVGLALVVGQVKHAPDSLDLIWPDASSRDAREALWLAFLASELR
jgi:hypothetical protein